MIECAEYKLTIEVCADKVADLEQLLCVIAEQVQNGAVTGNGGGRTSSYTFNVEEAEQNGA